MHLADIGIDPSLGLSADDHRAVVGEAIRLGYRGAWTPAGRDRTALSVCALWHAEARALGDHGFRVGVSVVPSPEWSLEALAAEARRVHDETRGQFVLGIGCGRLRERPIEVMREHLTRLRALLPRDLPIYLAALGPRMLRLAGELADGAALNWCTAEQVAWSRGRVERAARGVGRNPVFVALVEYVRVCVDDDPDAARRALAKAVLPYVFPGQGRSLDQGYPAHFVRQGLGEVLSDLVGRRERGASEDELADAFPADALSRVGAYGTESDVGGAFLELAADLDIGIVRVVGTTPGRKTALRTIRAAAPPLPLPRSREGR